MIKSFLIAFAFSFFVLTLSSQPGSAHPATAKRPVAASRFVDVQQLLTDRFGLDEAKSKLAKLKLEKLDPSSIHRAMAWKAYKASPLHVDLKRDFDQNIVQTSDRKSPYRWRTVGTKPADGWALVIAMHGGGSGPKQMNDREWDYMFQKYYNDHPEAGGYVYLALRAPNDEWNGFYDNPIGPLIEKLIKQFVIFGEVDPSRVYTLGASHGGYGAFVIGTKIPFRFAAVHASAGAPTDGETKGENLRNLRFTWMVGEKDTAYGRADRDQKFAVAIEEWKKKYNGGYPGEFEFMKDTGHFVPDHDKLAEMLKLGKREAWPNHLVWTQTDTFIKRFYWIEALNPVEGGTIEATVDKNLISLTLDKQKDLTIWLSSALIDIKKPVQIAVNGGKPRTFKFRLDLESYCASLENTSDPVLAGVGRVNIKLGE